MLLQVLGQIGSSHRTVQAVVKDGGTKPPAILLRSPYEVSSAVEAVVNALSGTDLGYAATIVSTLLSVRSLGFARY
eukprot:3435600-Rhodomonas_salina.13